MGKPGSNNESEGELAPQVCLNCKVRKRKCSKELPACALCSRLLLNCDYEYTLPSNTDSLQKATSSSSMIPSSLPNTTPTTTLTSVANLFAIVSSHSTRQSLPNQPQKQPSFIPREILDILTTSGESVPSVTAAYFRTVDTWLPLLHQETFMHQIERVLVSDNMALASLLLAMFLITRPPPAVGFNPLSSEDGVYFKTKALVSTLSASGNVSVEIAQAGLLLVLYEIGHGFEEQSRIGMATLVGVTRRLIGDPRRVSMGEIQKTGVGRLWWGIVVLDSYMNSGIPEQEIYLAAGIPTYEPKFVDLPITLGRGGGLLDPRRPWSGEEHVCRRLPYFCRAARSGHLLGKTLDLVRRSVYESLDEGEVGWLDTVLQETALGLLRQTVGSWEECCPAIRLCLSALLSLHTRIWELSSGVVGQEHRKQGAGLAIRSTARMIIDISYRFNVDLGFIDIPALPLPSMGCIYQAAIAYIRFSGEDFLGEEWCRNLESLKGTLEHFSKRWGVGGLYLERIQKAVAEEVGLRSQLGGHDGFQGNYGI